MLHLFLTFQSLIIHSLIIDNPGDLDIVMPLHNLIECSKSYSRTTGSLWNYSRDEPNSGVGSENNKVSYYIKASTSFHYKISIIGKLEGIDTEKEDKIAALLKYLSNFWRTLRHSIN